MSVEEWATTIDSSAAAFKGAQSAWDLCLLGGEVIPGVCQVTCSVPSGLDIRKPKGGKRASIADNGDPPVRLRIRVELLPATIGAFSDNIVPILRQRDKSGGRPPLAIVHPEAELWGVDTVAVDTVESPPPSPGGTKIITINCVEWAEAPAKVKPSKKVKSGNVVTIDQVDIVAGDETPPGADQQFAQDAQGVFT